MDIDRVYPRIGLSPIGSRFFITWNETNTNFGLFVPWTFSSLDDSSWERKVHKPGPIVFGHWSVWATLSGLQTYRMLRGGSGRVVSGKTCLCSNIAITRKKEQNELPRKLICDSARPQECQNDIERIKGMHFTRAVQPVGLQVAAFLTSAFLFHVGSKPTFSDGAVFLSSASGRMVTGVDIVHMRVIKFKKKLTSL